MRALLAPLEELGEYEEIKKLLTKEQAAVALSGCVDSQKLHMIYGLSDGNIDEAVEVLRKSGAAKAEKKASRIAAEGICRVAIDGNKATVVEVNSETDFVAKNEVFQTFVQAVADKAVAHRPMLATPLCSVGASTLLVLRVV